MLGGRGCHPAWRSQAGPPGSPPTCPGKSPGSCVLEQLEAEVRGGGARLRVRVGGPLRQEAPTLGPRRAEGRAGWPASPEPQRAPRVQRGCEPPAMWFQSNCPKILLQHKPRAIHSPATNQRQSYRINRFHTRGTGSPAREPGRPGQGAPARAIPPGLFPVGSGAIRTSGVHHGGSSSLCNPHPLWGGTAGRWTPLVSQSIQAPEAQPGHGGHSGPKPVSRGLAGARGPRVSPASSPCPDFPP